MEEEGEGGHRRFDRRVCVCDGSKHDPMPKATIRAIRAIKCTQPRGGHGAGNERRRIRRKTINHIVMKIDRLMPGRCWLNGGVSADLMI